MICPGAVFGVGTTCAPGRAGAPAGLGSASTLGDAQRSQPRSGMPKRRRRLSSSHTWRRARWFRMRIRSRAIGSLRIWVGASRSAASRCRIASASRSVLHQRPGQIEMQRRRPLLTVQRGHVQRRAGGFLVDPAALTELDTDSQAPHGDVSGTEVHAQPVALPDPRGDLPSLVQVRPRVVVLFVSRRALRRQQVHHAQHLRT